MTSSLFRSGLVPRLGSALAFAVLAFGAVLLLRGERRQTAAAETPARTETASEIQHQPAAHAQASTAAAGEQIEIESVRAVGSWTVRLDGETIAATKADAHAWSGFSDAPAAVMSIDAAPVHAAAGAANSLRIRLRSGNTGIEWLEWIDPGEIVVLPLDQLRAQAPAP
ncbi:MAG: hypothetical protein ACREIA_10660 [Opitutaceae bacterium]